MNSTETVQPTSTERKTAKLKERFAAHIREWWPKQDAEFRDKEYNYHIEDGPFQIWSCELSNRRMQTPQQDLSPSPADPGVPSSGSDKSLTLWLLWDKKEVTSYDDEGDAYIDLINGQKTLRLESKMKYYTSPLTISAVLAIILFSLIAVMEMFRYTVPDQLWSVFTAVVAFYFGKESSRRSAEQALDE